MPSEIEALYEDLCDREIVSREDVAIRTAFGQAEALTGWGMAIGYIGQWLYRRLAVGASLVAGRLASPERSLRGGD